MGGVSGSLAVLVDLPAPTIRPTIRRLLLGHETPAAAVIPLTIEKPVIPCDYIVIPMAGNARLKPSAIFRRARNVLPSAHNTLS